MGGYRHGAIVTTETLAGATGFAHYLVRRHVKQGKVDIQSLVSVTRYIAFAKLMGYGRTRNEHVTFK